VTAAGAQPPIVSADLAEPSAAQSIVEQTLAAFGRIDALLISPAPSRKSIFSK